MFKVSVPGSVMLMGEHAVLHGYPAIVAAINRRIQTTLIPRSDQIIHIDAEHFGNLVIPAKAEIQKKTAWIPDNRCAISRMTNSQNYKKLSYVLAAIQQLQDIIPSGFDLQIKADFSDKLGLGSSAAVTVAVLTVMHKWLVKEINLTKIHELGVKTVHVVQNGLGSGADIAASVYGGIIMYQMQPLQIEKINIIPEITLIYTGYKTPTVEVINKINKMAQNSPEYFNNLYRIIGDLVKQGVKYFKQQNWQQLGQLFLLHFAAQQALGVSDTIIDTIVEKIKTIPTVYGAKISGAGLGDCVVALGKVTASEMQLVDVKIDMQGIICNR